MKINIKLIAKYITAVVCLILLLTAATVPVVRLITTGDNFEEERIVFEQAIHEDFNSFLPELNIKPVIFRSGTNGRTSISIIINQKEITENKENKTGYTNAQIIAHVRNFCLDYLDEHKSGDLYKALNNNNSDSNFNISVLLDDKRYLPWENLDSMTFDNIYSFSFPALSDNEEDRLYNKLNYMRDPITMGDLMNFTDLSQISVNDITVDSLDEYDFSAFTALKVLYISELKESDTQKINAIKRTLPDGCKLCF